VLNWEGEKVGKWERRGGKFSLSSLYSPRLCGEIPTVSEH
jgi:hypothetical protein